MDSFQDRWNQVPDSKPSRRALIDTMAEEMMNLEEPPPRENIAKVNTPISPSAWYSLEIAYPSVHEQQ